MWVIVGLVSLIILVTLVLCIPLDFFFQVNISETPSFRFRLLWLFGRSLISGRVALITRFARFFHGEISQAVERYTRQVTILWCVFFSGMLIVDFTLFTFVSTDAWLFFANVLNLPFLIGTFIAEFVYRSFRFPDWPYPSLGATVAAFRRFYGTYKEQ